MSEYIFVHLINKQPVGANLGKSIPLHMTALHWFSTKALEDEISAAMKSLLTTIKPFSVTATNEALFGPDKDVAVAQLERTPEIVVLHVALLQAMQRLDAAFDDRWVGEEKWLPHVTHQKDARLHVGDICTVNDIDLIMRSGESGDRIIIDRITL